MARTQISSICRQCRSQFGMFTNSQRQRWPSLLQQNTATRPFSSSRYSNQDDLGPERDQDSLPPTPTSQSSPSPAATNSSTNSDMMSDIVKNIANAPGARQRNPRAPGRFASQQLDNIAATARASADTRQGSGVSIDEPYHLNVYTHKHNTHITFTEPSRNPILSFSSGNIGLRKSQRGTFDAAYQLTTYTLRKMAEKQWRLGGKDKTMNQMLTLNEAEVRDRGIEVVLRGYGRGREAFQKALLGTEGRIIKPLIKKVTDSTRLKFGGVRSRAVRRLG